MDLITMNTDKIIGPATTRWGAVAQELAPELDLHAAEHDRTGAFVADAFDRLRTAGLVSALVPGELGGGGATYPEAAEVLRVLGRACGSTAVALSMHYHLVGTQVWRYLHGLPAEAVLRRVAEQNLVLVSTGASDWVDSSGWATPVDGGYRVTARKAPASGAPAGDLLVTSARADGPDGPQVLHFAVPFSAPGFSIDETWDSLGLRASGSHTAVLDDVFVPEQAVVLARPAGVWHPFWNAVLGTALPLIMSAYVGIGDAAVELALEAARPKANEPHVAPLVGTLLNHHAVLVDAVDAMVRAADGLRFDNDDAAAAFALTRKTVAATALQDTVRAAIEVVGGAAFSRAHPLERLVRDAMGAWFHPLPEAKQVQFTGRVALGLAPVG